jgi:putative peptide zinc metalloprotease protein
MFLGMLDGQTTVDEAWDACNAQLGDDAPTQRECIELLGKLQLFGLLRGRLPLEVDMLKERSHDIRKRHFEQLTGKFVFMTLPLLNPEPFLRRFAGVGRFIFSRWGFMLWLVLMIAALLRLAPRIGEFGSNLNGILDPGNLIWLTVIFIVLKAVHEFSHAFACKAYGGRVTEMGIMLMLFLPIPYCNATDSWGFAEKWKRIAVASAGMYGEFAVAAIAAIVWSATEPGVVHTIAFNTIFIASVTTLLFNLNPLLRYDGYYILSDSLEIPNLANRSNEMLKHLICTKIFGVKELREPHYKDRTEQVLLVTYALCSMPYRLLIITGIIVAVTYEYPVVGIMLAVLGLVMWIAFPIGKGITFLLTSPILHQVRPRAVLISGAFAAAVIIFFGVIPWPAHSYADGVVEPRNRVVLRAAEAGFVEEILAQPGETVTENQPVVVLRSDQRLADLAQARASFNIEQVRLDQAKSKSEVEHKIAEQQVEAARRALAAAAEHVQRLTIESPVTGQLVAPDLLDLQGAFVEPGKPLGRVSTLDDIVIRATVDQHKHDWLFLGRGGTPSAEIRVRGQAGKEIPATIERFNPAGKRELIAPQLSTMAGGEVTMDPTSQNQQRTLRPQYIITLKAENGEAVLVPGARVRVQFTNGSEPLLFGWSRRIYQAFLQKFPW